MIYYQDEEDIKYRKRPSKKPPKKSNHKHEYEPIIAEYFDKNFEYSKERGFISGTRKIPARRCKICGRIENGFLRGYREDTKVNWLSGNSDIEKYFSDLPVIKVKTIWINPIEEIV